MGNTLNIEKKKYVGAFVRQAFADFKKHWKVLVLAMVVIYAISFLGEMIVRKTDYNLLVQFIYQIFVTFISFGFMKMMLNTIDRKTLSVKQLFTGVTAKQFIIAILASILVGVFMVLGLFLLIVPGIIIAIALSMTTYIILDKNMGVWSSIKYSWNITKDKRFRMFVLGLIAMLIMLAGFLALGVGLLVAVPVVSLMQVRLYRELAEGESVVAEEEVEVEAIEVIEEVEAETVSEKTEE